MRSPIEWFGGKGNMVKKILPYITDHREYIEPFFGGGSIFFAKRPAKVETINDLNSDVMNFFKILRDEPKEFLRLAKLTPYSRELYNECRLTYRDEVDPIKKVWKWFVVARMSFSGRFGASWSFNVTASNRGMAGTCSKFLSTIDYLPQVIERLKRVQIENTDALKVIDAYTTENSLCYCDPPYVSSTRSAGKYEHEMTDKEHEDFLNLLLETPGKVIISGYSSELYEEYLSDWHRIEFKTACHVAGRTKACGIQGKGSALEKQARTEYLWLNENAFRASGEQLRLY